jgi:hypothetical protein
MMFEYYFYIADPRSSLYNSFAAGIVHRGAYEFLDFDSTGSFKSFLKYQYFNYKLPFIFDKNFFSLFSYNSHNISIVS